MKIEAKIDGDGFPVLFFPDTPWDKRAKLITCFAQHDGHSGASRGYMRQCKAPATVEEFKAMAKLLKNWCSSYL